ncbi:helix-turn-helix domain-containing protein [Bacillus massiliglaciei]|uniref:helix-turn-helix domain-containing protein n=1 Tax=Bacillus massiliglaciei TaxID=1816693 RepID=UPI000DA61194|nr:helix-turn-helix domain-containing protein [Bacillus massiliglaciei]
MGNEEFGLHLRNLRKKKGLTLEELGKLSDLSQPYLSQIENGKRAIPSPEILYKLSKPLGVDHVHLMIKAGHLQGEENDYLESPLETELRKLEDGKLKEKMQKIQNAENDIINILFRPNIHYRGVILTKEDRRKLADMIDIMLRNKEE